MPGHSGEAAERRPVKIAGVVMHVAVLMIGSKTLVYGPFPSPESAADFLRTYYRRTASRTLAQDCGTGKRATSGFTVMHGSVVPLLDPEEVQ